MEQNDGDAAPRRAYRVSEIAQAMSIGKSTLYKMIAAGTGPRVVKLGAATLVLREDFEAWRAALRH